MPISSPYVAILDVGHGNSTVIRDNDNVMIVDCGSKGPYLLEFLIEEEIDKINTVFLSHSDQDHIGGLLVLLTSSIVQIGAVYVNADATKGSKLWHDLSIALNDLHNQGKLTPHVSIYQASGAFHCGLVSLQIVSPSTFLALKGAGGKDRNGEVITSNSLSASFHVIWNGQSIAYLSGDIDQVALNEIVHNLYSLQTQLLVYPHHGGIGNKNDNEAFAKQICHLTQASTVIFSIGRNKHNNPRSEVIAAVRSIIPDVRIACTQLSKSCASFLPNTSPSYLFPSIGQSLKQCCSGTFIIHLGEQITYSPERTPHWNFILASAPTALCN